MAFLAVSPPALSFRCLALQCRNQLHSVIGRHSRLIPGAFCRGLDRNGSERLPQAQPTQRIMRDGRHRCFQPLHFESGSQLGMVLPLEVTFECVRRRFCLSRRQRAREAATRPAVRRITGPEMSGMLRSRNFVLPDHCRFLLNVTNFLKVHLTDVSCLMHSLTLVFWVIP